ncbi:hypothetical protein NLU13_0766 [Sarocladium strictum]|uniref:Pentatricopeptide repeat-containing protein n=1 Tax=Sarocladium strictum TaxID=5046 RepID=A0AA39LBQ9_SARSR|nr:hypothetical protein NLU13_0766 [Sarocladium strictum]
MLLPTRSLNLFNSQRPRLHASASSLYYSCRPTFSFVSIISEHRNPSSSDRDFARILHSSVLPNVLFNAIAIPSLGTRSACHMLERTVTSLESCSLQRFLPQAASQAKSAHHRLRTGFWQHGALAIELSRSWAAVIEQRQQQQKQKRRTQADKQTTRPIESDLQASVFLLDFLYPSVQRNKSRRGRRHTCKDIEVGGERRRTYGTSAGLPVLAAKDEYAKSNSADATYMTLSQRGAQTDRATLSDAVTNEGISQAEPITRVSDQVGLDELLARVDPQCTGHLDIYDSYARLDPDDRIRYRSRVVVALTKSRNIVARNRSEALIRQITEEEWNDEVLAAIVQHYMRKNQRPVAVNYFKRGAKQFGLSGGLGPLLVDMFKRKFWSGALKIWQTWYEAQTTAVDGEPSVDALAPVLTLGDALPGLYFSFEQYLASSRARELEADTLRSTNAAVTAFRQYFSGLALERSLPKRAEVLLGFYKSSTLYNQYLETMTTKWIRREIDRETAGGLPKIYENYRQEDDFKPSEAVLQGMFEVYYPHRLSELDALQDDWRRAHGELSAAAFNKYLKLHAKLGNVTATHELIDRYYKARPAMDKHKGILRLMAVYARQGDVKSVRDLIESIPRDIAKHFDRSIHRNLLMACVKDERYEEAVSCFNEMGARGLLDSADFAQIMHMHSKKGDLDSTLRYFALAQDNKIDITPGMVLAMELALIGNDRLSDAEFVVVEMADRGITSTAIWNELIKAHGIVGNLPRCYGILTIMKQRNIEYLPSTYEATLAAMIRYGQIGPAIALLKDAAKHNTFKPTGEHYAMVMAGAVRMRDFDVLPALAKKLQDFSERPTFAAQVALLAAAVHGDKSLDKAKTIAVEVLDSLQALSDKKRILVTSPKLATNVSTNKSKQIASLAKSTAETQLSANLTDVSPSALRHATTQIGHAVALVVELRDKLTVEELISKFLELQIQKSGDPLPETLMSSLMRAFYQDGEYHRALEIWHRYWAEVRDRWMDPKTGLVRPNKQYALVYLFDIVARCLRDLQDGEELGRFVMRVYATGFKMSNNNWNLIVKALADLGHLESAMNWCEIMLMPHWRGWQRFPDPKMRTPQTNKFIRAINKANLDYHFMRPHQDTVLLLRDKYLELRQLAAWDPEKAALKRRIDNDNPRLGFAFAKAPPGFQRSETKWRFGRGVSYDKRLDQFVAKLSAQEASSMMHSLKKLLHPQAMRDPEKLRQVLSAAIKDGYPDQLQADIMNVLMDPSAERDDGITDTPATNALLQEEPGMLEEKVQQKVKADRRQGDEVIALRMKRWRERPRRRNKFTRWNDQWAGLADKMNAPP